MKRKHNKKIIIICGSLEPGKDGVGDYTRRLAGELIRNGYNAAIVGINDRIATNVQKVQQQDEEIYIETLRLPRTVSWNKRVEFVKTFIQDHNPQLLSLQYVPFAYHTKGLPFSLATLLKSIGAGRKWHIMFHELWVGIDQESSFKIKLWGGLQRRIILNTIKVLAPKIIHTNTSTYAQVLNSHGFTNKILPLFSNISPISFDASEKGTFKIVVFGSIHPTNKVASFIADLKTTSVKQLQPVEIIFLGRNGDLRRYWEILFQKANFKTMIIGETSSDEISYYLNLADLCLTTTPYYQIEKSGTVMAALAHKTFVYCLGRDWTPVIPLVKPVLKNVKEYISVFSFDDCEFEETSVMTSADVADKFISDLSI